MIKYCTCLLAVTLFFLTLPADSNAGGTHAGNAISDNAVTDDKRVADFASEMPADAEPVTDAGLATEAESATDTESVTETGPATETDDVNVYESTAGTESESKKESVPETEIADGSNETEAAETVKYLYSTDVSEYLQYIDPGDDSPYLILANRDNPITDYVPVKLISKSGMNGNKMEEAAAMAFRAMYLEMKAEKVKLPEPVSTYRTYDLQKKVHAGYFANEKKAHPDLSDEEIEKIVCTYSAPAGMSEHQTGLAADLSPLKNSFSKTPTYKWLKKYAYKFGFIERFPKDKTEITGYNWEPWHWRFVGRDAATYIYENGMCLEEYAAVIGQQQIKTETTKPDRQKANIIYGE